MRLHHLALTTIFLASLAYGQAGSGMRGSKHDFSGATWNSSRKNEICAVCHIPHVEGRSGTQLGNPLLWGRSLSQATYTLYSSPTLDNNIYQPDGTAKLCLGCHDGSVALQHFDGTTTGGTFFVTGIFKVPGKPTGTSPGTDFSNTHPVSVVYDETKDPGLHPKTNIFKGSSTIQDALEFDGTNFKVQCRTCHDVHNRDVEAPSSGNSFLLRVAVNNTTNPSKLCLTCHDK